MSASTDPQFYASNVQSMYDTRSQGYDDSFHGRFAKDMVNLVSNPPPSPGNKVIDFACGTGLATFLFAERISPGGEIWGIDLSGGMLEMAKKKKSQLPSEVSAGIHLIQHNVEDVSGVEELSGMEASIDVITCIAALVLMQDVEATIRAWGKFLKPGGQMVFEVPHPHTHRHGAVLELAATKMGLNPPWNRRWVKDEESLQKMLSKADPSLKVERIVVMPYAGENLQPLEPTQEVAEHSWDKIVYGRSTGDWRSKHDAATLEKLKAVYIEEWISSANNDGKVDDLDIGWAVVARKD